MRKLVLTSLMAIVVLWAGIANAGTEVAMLDLCNPGCCEFTCITVDVECCGWCADTAPLKVEFLGRDGAVLGMTMIEDQWCDGCVDVHFAQLDAPVELSDVCTIKVTAEMDDCCYIEWMAIKVLCQEPCCKSSWRTAWKGDIWWWDAA